MRFKRPIRSILKVVFRHAPLEAQLMVTRRCNLSCGYCSEYDNVSASIPLAILKQRIDVGCRSSTSPCSEANRSCIPTWRR